MAFRPPFIDPRSLASFISKHFPFASIDVQSIKEFVSYDDRNYFFVGEFKSNTNRIRPSTYARLPSTSEFVIKFMNSRYFKDIRVVDGLTKLTKFLGDNQFKCPYPIPSLHKSEIVVVKHSELLPYTNIVNSTDSEKDSDHRFTQPSGSLNGTLSDRHYCVGVFTFVQGEMFGYEEQPPELLHELGCYLGRMNSVMKDFSHSGLDGRNTVDWDLRFVPTRRELIPGCTSDPEKRQILSGVLDDFENYVVPMMHDTSTEWGFIHNDVNPMNIVILRDVSGALSINGLIDFNESVPSPYVFELGVAMAYLMMRRDDPINYIKPLIQGYLSVFPLSKASLDIVYYVVLGRLALSYINGMHAYKEEPTNEYILVDTAPGWVLMNQLLKEGKEKCYREWGLMEENH